MVRYSTCLAGSSVGFALLLGCGGLFSDPFASEIEAYLAERGSSMGMPVSLRVIEYGVKDLARAKFAAASDLTRQETLSIQGPGGSYALSWNPPADSKRLDAARASVDVAHRIARDTQSRHDMIQRLVTAGFLKHEGSYTTFLPFRGHRPIHVYTPTQAGASHIYAYQTAKDLRSGLDADRVARWSTALGLLQEFAGLTEVMSPEEALLRSLGIAPGVPDGAPVTAWFDLGAPSIVVERVLEPSSGERVVEFHVELRDSDVIAAIGAGTSPQTLQARFVKVSDGWDLVNEGDVAEIARNMHGLTPGSTVASLPYRYEDELQAGGLIPSRAWEVDFSELHERAEMTSFEFGCPAVDADVRVRYRKNWRFPSPITLHGVGSYSSNSDICFAAVHAGVLDPDKGGTVSFEATPPVLKFPGSFQNGVLSTASSAWWEGLSPEATTYRFTGPKRPFALKAEDIWAVPFSVFDDEAASVELNCPAGSLPDVIAANVAMVAGSNPYAEYSSVCLAAIHAGTLDPAVGGPVRFKYLGYFNDQGNQGSTRHGVQSKPNRGADADWMVLP